MATAKHDPGFPAAVIFDLDGTLIDSGRDLAAAANAARSEVGREPLPDATAIGYVGDGVEMLVRRMLAHGTATPAPRVPPAEVARGLTAFRAFYATHALDHTRCYPEVEAMLDACGPRPLFVATNKSRQFTRQILEALGLATRFARVVAGDDVPGRKPEPDHLAACLAGYDVPPVRVAVVGDGTNDVRAARAFGALAVAVTYGLTPRAELLAVAPDFLADSPRDVIRVLGLDQDSTVRPAPSASSRRNGPSR
jgi:phosphoglycolate phosphatase